jgi:hypothetical protein
LDTKNNKAFPLDPACLERRIVRSLAGLSYSCNSIAIQIATNEQLKDLTYMFCFRIPCYKLYKKGLLSYVITLKIHVAFWDELKKG